MKKDLVSITDTGLEDINKILDLAAKVKKEKAAYVDALKGKSIGLIFQKPSNRTRVSFEVGMYQLGGNTVYLGPSEIDMGGRESVKDVACVLSRYVDGIVARTFKHIDVKDIAKFASVPVINGLSDLAHPCQALTDIFTIKEKLGAFKGVTLSYLGDGNNVLNSLMVLSGKVGINMKIATPKGYEPARDIAKLALEFAKRSGSSIEFFNDSKKAAKDANIVYTDVWVSMGQEKEQAKRLKVFKGFQVNDSIMKLAKPSAIAMHCLPAHRGQEITDSVIDSKKSAVYDQAENRMHVEKAILLVLLGNA